MGSGEGGNPSPEGVPSPPGSIYCLFLSPQNGGRRSSACGSGRAHVADGDANQKERFGSERGTGVRRRRRSRRRSRGRIVKGPCGKISRPSPAGTDQHADDGEQPAGGEVQLPQGGRAAALLRMERTERRTMSDIRATNQLRECSRGPIIPMHSMAMASRKAARCRCCMPRVRNSSMTPATPVAMLANSTMPRGSIP